MKKSLSLIGIVLFVFCSLFICNAAYAGWMEGTVLKASTVDDGEVIIKFFRNSNSTQINAYVEESLSTSSKNAILAIALTAISTGATVDIFYDWDTKRYESLAIISP